MKTEIPVSKPSYHKYVISILLLTTILGWSWAWKLHAAQSSEKPQSNEPARASTQRQKTTTSNNSDTQQLAAIIPTPRSAELYAKLDRITANAKKGEVNQLLVDACTATLNDGDGERRSRDLALLVDIMRPEDAFAIHLAFEKLHHEGKGFPGEYASFAKRWGEMDAKGALKALFEQKPAGIPFQDFNYLMTGWCRTNPQEAIKWVEENPEAANMRGGIASVINGWMSVDPEAALQYAISRNDLPPHMLGQAIHRGAMQQLYNKGSEASADWLASLPDNQTINGTALDSWKYTCMNYSEVNPEVGAKLIAKFANKSWMTPDAFFDFALMTTRSRSDNDQARSDQFFQELEKSMTPDQIQQKFQQWQEQNPERVNSLKGNPDNSPYLQKLLQSLPATEQNK